MYQQQHPQWFSPTSLLSPSHMLEEIKQRSSTFSPRPKANERSPSDAQHVEVRSKYGTTSVQLMNEAAKRKRTDA